MIKCIVVAVVFLIVAHNGTEFTNLKPIFVFLFKITKNYLKLLIN